MKRIFVILLIILMFLNCSRKSPLEECLKLAGNNKGELLKVLEHYRSDPKDSLKLKAALFLIENMPFHYSYGISPDDYYKEIDSLYSLKLYNVKVLERKIDSLYQRYAGYPLEISYDPRELKASFLIAHIDQAFETRTYPWARDIDFASFCEYVLPYRISHEPVELWLPGYKSYFKGIIDSFQLRGLTSAAKVCEEVTDGWKRTQQSIEPRKFPLPPSTFLKIQTGSCLDYTYLGAYVMRSLGLPVACDYTPNWGNRSQGHDWNTLVTGSQNINFQIGNIEKFGDHISKRKDKFAKAYRRTYSICRESLALQQTKENIPELFQDPFMKDVSHLYFDAVDITVDLIPGTSFKPDLAYIMVFDNQTWVPVHWGWVRNKEVCFTQMAKNCAYLVMYYHNNTYDIASDPFYADESGKINYFVPDETRRVTARLKRKHPVLGSQLFQSLMQGGWFEGANKPDFSDAVSLYVIDSLPEARYNIVDLAGNMHRYEYFRYHTPSRGNYMNVAEIEVYNEKGELLKGEVIGTDGSHENSGNDKYKVFDGETLTYFNSPHIVGDWVGLAFDRKELVKQIAYLPRNDDNFIREGEDYELFYWKNGWVSLGRQVGRRKTQELVYHNVPSGALLLLRNLTKGKEERIFTYEDGEQVWW